MSFNNFKMEFRCLQTRNQTGFFFLAEQKKSDEIHRLIWW